MEAIICMGTDNKTQLRLGQVQTYSFLDVIGGSPHQLDLI